jgi:uncharacterized repeat protein (TIGR01451 family)
MGMASLRHGRLGGTKRARRAALQLVATGLAIGFLVLAAGSRGATLPSGFQESVVFSGLTNPTNVEFAPDGRVFVAEKSGLIKAYDSVSDTTATQVADLRPNVHDFWDRGLLGLAVHPQFPAQPYLYVLYTYDAPIGATAPTFGDACADPTGNGCVVSGRLSRVNASTGAEQVLITDWCQQYPSHSIGSLAFGSDGALYVSGGDGASFNFTDWGQDGNPVNPCGDPPAAPGTNLTPPTAEGGALRSQDVRTLADPTSLDGAILRVDPSTGAGLPTNPLAASSDANARRIVAYGLRNPFRITTRPGTSEVWIGDVGWNLWEEIDRVADPLGPVVENFGWPCYEGDARQSGYDGANLSLCETLYAQGPVVAPYYTYHHNQKVVNGEPCRPANPGTATSSSVGGIAFYEGGAYPAAYTGSLFFADYSRDCIWVMFAGANGLPDAGNRATFVADAANPVDLEIGAGGDLFYVDFNGGTVRRVQYFAANQPPVAVAGGSPTSGPAPLTVTFSGASSSDPEGAALTYAWDLDGDGAFDDASVMSPVFTYSQPGTYNARLRVTDPMSASSTSLPVTITANNTPPSASIATPTQGTTWRVGQTISFSGTATDQQQGTLPTSALAWQLVILHGSCPNDCHEHPVQSWNATSSGSFTAPDHEYPSQLELRLTATDAGGLTHTVTRQLLPRTVQLSFQTSPSGLQLVVGSSSQPTPFTRTVIEGSVNTVSAPSPQSLGGASYSFATWSNGGAATHSLTANAAATYTASYTATISADLRLVKTGTLSGTTATWVLTVSNLGPNTAQNVVVTDTLPSRITSPSLPAGCTYNSSTRIVTCAIASLANGGSTTFSIPTTVTGKGSGWITNTAQVTSATPDPATGNNASSHRLRR